MLTHAMRGSFGLIIRFTSANFLVFFVLPIAAVSRQALCSCWNSSFHGSRIYDGIGIAGCSSAWLKLAATRRHLDLAPWCLLAV